MSKTMDILRSEHRNISRLLDLLDRQLDLFEKTGLPDYELLAEIIDYLRSFPDLYHHPKEDMVLAKLRIRAPGKAAEVGNLEKDHDRVAARLNAFTRAVANVLLGAELPRDEFLKRARDFVDGERRHRVAEERVFFPAALENLTEEDWRDIDQRGWLSLLTRYILSKPSAVLRSCSASYPLPAINPFCDSCRAVPSTWSSDV